MGLIQAVQPIIVHVVETPVESTTVADVLIGAIGLTGVLVLLAALLGGVLGATLVGIKILRQRYAGPAPDSGTIHIV